jgi:Integrase core domain
MLQQARNLLMALDDRDRHVRFLIHDRDTKFPRAFDDLLATEKIKVIRTPVQAPNANAHMERWVGSVRRECLDRLLILGRRQLEYVLRIYVQHHNGRRPHRALDLEPPDPTPPVAAARDDPPAPLTTCADATSSAASSTNTNSPPDRVSAPHASCRGSYGTPSRKGPMARRGSPTASSRS